MISGIKKKAVQAQLGMTYSTKPKGIVVGDDSTNTATKDLMKNYLKQIMKKKNL